MTAALKGYASADQVLDAYKGDSKVMAVTAVWPATAVEKVALVSKAQRRAEDILTRYWEVWAYDLKDFRGKVYAVWSRKKTDPIWTWTVGDLFDHMDADPNWGSREVDSAKWAAVQAWRPRMKANPLQTIGPLISFQDPSGRILLDDGHTRLTAAHLEKVDPPTIFLYLGKIVIGAQNGPTSACKMDPPRSKVPNHYFVSHPSLLLSGDGLVATLPPPGETESGSAGTQPDKG